VRAELLSSYPVNDNDHVDDHVNDHVNVNLNVDDHDLTLLCLSPGSHSGKRRKRGARYGE